MHFLAGVAQVVVQRQVPGVVDSAVPVEVPLLQFIDGRRHPCYGGPDSACGGAAVAVVFTVVDIFGVAQRQVGCALLENCEVPQLQFVSS